MGWGRPGKSGPIGMPAQTAAPQVPTPPETHGSGPVTHVPWTWVDGIAVFVLTLALTFVLGGALTMLPDTGLVSPGVMDAVFLPFFFVVLIGTTLGWVRMRYPGRVGRLVGWVRPQGRHVVAGLGLGLLAFAVINLGVTAILELVAQALGADLPAVQEGFREAARDPEMAPFFVAGAVLFAPAAEELFFRGMLFPGLAKRVGVWPGIVLSAALFSLLHMSAGAGSASNLLVAALILPLGVLLAWLYQRRGTLVVPFVVHAIFNLAGVVLLIAFD